MVQIKILSSLQKCFMDETLIDKLTNLGAQIRRIED